MPDDCEAEPELAVTWGRSAVVDPLSLGAIGGVALAEGIKFLYGQVSELLKRRRNKAEKAETAPVVPAAQLDVLDGPVVAKPVDLAVVDANEGKLLELAGGLSNYANG